MIKSDDELTLLQIALTHGQAKWVLRHFNMLDSDSEASFDTFLKSLRRDGVPFSADELGVGAGNNLVYRYENLMELALAMTLRTNGIMSRDLVRVIEHNRKRMRHFFKRAYLERETGVGAPVDVYFSDVDVGLRRKASARDGKPDLRIQGTYLDLSLIYLPSGNLNMLKFEFLSARQAVAAFMAGHRKLYPRPPIPISDIACDIVALATSDQMPVYKRGRSS